MQQPTTRELFAYWDTIRNGRIAPQRFEVEPSKISGLLRETFIAECGRLLAFRFRLAGTRICQQFGRELRGMNFLSLWSNDDRNAVASTVRNIINDGAVGHGTFAAYSDTGRKAEFEFVLLPLIHSGSAIDRILGAITALEPPFWLGTEPLISFEITSLTLHWPDDMPPYITAPDPVAARRRFRVVEGGLSGQTRPQ